MYYLYPWIDIFHLMWQRNNDFLLCPGVLNNIATTGYPDSILANQLFQESLSALTGAIAPDATSYSQRLFAATHATSIEVFSSAGSKHAITLNFRKESTSTDANTPSVWNWYAEAPEPSTFDYPASGVLKFNEDGSLQSFSPPTLTFNPNTGAASGQIVQLDFGSINGFNGMTSFSAESNTAARNRDGYAGGFLKEITVDQTGTVIGTFSNDQNFKLAQVALALLTRLSPGIPSGWKVVINVSKTSPNSLVRVAALSCAALPVRSSNPTTTCILSLGKFVSARA